MLLKTSQKLTLSALIASLSVVLLLLSRVITIGMFALPVIAGMLLTVIMLEAGAKWAVAAYVVSAGLSVLLANPEASLVYIVFFGYYPLLKAPIEKINRIPVEWIIKVALFNATVIGGYVVFYALFFSLKELFAIGTLILAFSVIGLNIMFVLFDIALSRLITHYFVRLHPIINKIFKH